MLTPYEYNVILQLSGVPLRCHDCGPWAKTIFDLEERGYLHTAKKNNGGGWYYAYEPTEKGRAALEPQEKPN